MKRALKGIITYIKAKQGLLRNCYLKLDTAGMLLIPALGYRARRSPDVRGQPSPPSEFQVNVAQKTIL